MSTVSEDALRESVVLLQGLPETLHGFLDDAIDSFSSLNREKFYPSMRAYGTKWYQTQIDNPERQHALFPESHRHAGCALFTFTESLGVRNAHTFGGIMNMQTVLSLLVSCDVGQAYGLYCGAAAYVRQCNENPLFVRAIDKYRQQFRSDRNVLFDMPDVDDRESMIFKGRLSYEGWGEFDRFLHRMSDTSQVLRFYDL